MKKWFISVLLMNGKELRSFSHWQILKKLHTQTLAEILKIEKFWSFSSLTAKLWKSVEMTKFEWKHDLQVFSWWIEQNFSSFSHFRILSEIAYSKLSRKLENWLLLEFSSFTVKLWKSVKMIKFQCKPDLQVFSWWMEKN